MGKVKMEDIEECVYKKDIGRILNRINVGSYSLEGKTGIIKHLKDNPIYECYFCDGFNYNCESYKDIEK